MRHRPLPIPSVRLCRWSAGSLAAAERRGHLPHCIEQLEVSGVLDNFRRLLRESDAEFHGLVFADSDLHKVIEAVAWEIAPTRTSQRARGTVAGSPFSTWGNRALGPMRVWLPGAPR